MAGWHPEHRVLVPLAQQRWRWVTFLHWSYDPSVVQALLPDDFAVHTHGGRAWVGLTPFMLRASPLPLLPPRWLALTGPELNARTYVRAPDGRDGLWFFTLEAARLPVVVTPRTTLGLPYRWAAMDARRDADTVTYRSRRRHGSQRPGLELSVEVGEPLTAYDRTDLETFLVGRWRAYTIRFGQRLWVPVQHEPWPLRQARVSHLREDLVADSGLPRPEGPPHVLFSPGVNARFGIPRPMVAPF